MSKADNDIPDDERRIREPVELIEPIRCSVSQASLDDLAKSLPLGPHIRDLIIMVDAQGQLGKKNANYTVELARALRLFENELYKVTKLRNTINTVYAIIVIIISLFGRDFISWIMPAKPVIKNEQLSDRSNTAAKIP